MTTWYNTVAYSVYTILLIGYLYMFLRPYKGDWWNFFGKTFFKAIAIVFTLIWGGIFWW